MASDPVIHVEVAGAPDPLDGLVALALPAGSSVADALAALGVTMRDEPGLGIWGRRAKPEAVLRDGDRIECWRALRIDPKAARRARVGR